MKTIQFKPLPSIRYYASGDDDNNKKAHYTLTFEKAIVGDVIKNSEWDDGTDDCEGCDDNEYILSPVISDEELDKALYSMVPDWSNIHSIFFDETCTVPRYKMGHFCKERKLKVTRVKEKADIIIYGPDYIDDMYNDTSSDFITKSHFLKKVAGLKKGKNMFDAIVPAIQACESELIEIVNCTVLEPKKGKIQGPYCYLTEDSNYEELIKASNLCHQDIILENLGQVKMDAEMFKRVCQMLESKDEENSPVAMEVMTNCNYGESLVYLLELMRKYYRKIHDIPDRKYVSFQALALYLDYTPKYSSRSLDEIIQIVAKKGKLTEDNYNLLLNLILEEEHSCMAGADPDDEPNNWRILKVDLSPKYKDQVIWNKPPVLVSEVASLTEEEITQSQLSNFTS